MHCGGQWNEDRPSWASGRGVAVIGNCGERSGIPASFHRLPIEACRTCFCGYSAPLLAEDVRAGAHLSCGSTNVFALEAGAAGTRKAAYFRGGTDCGSRRGSNLWHSAADGIYCSVFYARASAQILLLALEQAWRCDPRFWKSRLEADLSGERLCSQQEFCGICEMHSEHAGAHVVVGIGLNVNQMSFPRRFVTRLRPLLESVPCVPRRASGFAKIAGPEYRALISEPMCGIDCTAISGASSGRMAALCELKRRQFRGVTEAWMLRLLACAHSAGLRTVVSERTPRK